MVHSILCRAFYKVGSQCNDSVPRRRGGLMLVCLRRPQQGPFESIPRPA